MISRLYILICQFIKTTRFWKENALILSGLRYSQSTLSLAVLFSILAAICSAVSVGCLASFLQGLTNPSEPPIRSRIEWVDIMLLGTQADVATRVYRISALLIATLCLQYLFFYLGKAKTKTAILRLTNHLRKRLFDQLQSVSISFYSSTKTGVLMNTIRAEVNQVSTALEVLATAFIQGTTVVAYLFAMFYISWQLSVVSLVIFGLLSVIISSLVRRVRELSFEVTKANKQFTATSLEFINGVRTVRASGTNDFERDRFYQTSDKVNEVTDKKQMLALLVDPFLQGASSGMVIIMTAIAFNQLVSNGQIKSTALIAFLFALNRMGPLVTQLNNCRTQFSSLQGSLQTVTEMLQRDDKPYIPDGQIEFTRLQQSIDLVSVDFSYNEEKKVLQNITLSIPKGKTTAFVGESGAGKSTLADLIVRFYLPTSGKLLIDGTDLRNIRIDSLRQRMAVVSQDTFVFHASARENIAYGLRNISDSDIFDAAAQANALDFIKALPYGFETQLGDRGVRLSGGQRQRIAIARALLRNPDILILDEATSALDSVTEMLIQESLEKLSRGRTVITIAHRLSTIAQADKVIVLEEGRVAEQGNYHELIEKRGRLWNYHQAQYCAEQSV
ncbi:MAG: heterocyst formation ABC transporter subunit HepA [Cyanobacteria bacterium J06560_6]